MLGRPVESWAASVAAIISVKECPSTVNTCQPKAFHLSGNGSGLDVYKRQVYALLGDGECQEGQIWEAAMAAAHYKLDNLIAYLDYNQLQIDGPIRSVLNPEPFPDLSLIHI